ncbi:BT_3987 domain-containing protein [Compostibacter hankyongensis]|uniref:DUF1735 domain-containing protein n=1 Tax=Compostibacter hankyongensis TaxID=1007089 RepID=A0ABP8FXG6_9BACT
MTRRLRALHFQLATLTVLTVVSCKKQDSFHDETLPNVAAAFSTTNGRINVPSGNNFSKDPDKVTIPVKIGLSGSAPKIFSVDVAVDEDTANQLVESKVLQNAVVLPSQYYSLPQTVNLRFGSDTASFDVKVSQGAIENYYGKDLILALRLTAPTKGNTLDAQKSTAIMVLHTTGISRPEDIHFVYFTDAGHQLKVPTQLNYTMDQSNLIVPVTLSLGGTAGSAFTVVLKDAPDTVQTLIDDHTLTNTVLLGSGDFSLPNPVKFDANKNTATFNLSVKLDALKNHMNEQVALGLTLGNPTSHLLDSSRSTFVVVMDPIHLIETDITNQGTYTVQFENTTNANESSPKLVDNDINTKFLLFDFTSAWMQLQFATPQTTGVYTMTSGNDSPGRDPKDWQLLGSNDGLHWTVIDDQKGQTFSDRKQTKRYIIDNTVAFSYYRLNIQKNNGDGLFQLSEWRLLKRP